MSHVVVILEDEPFFRDLLERALLGEGIGIAAACATAEEFADAVGLHRPDVVVTDLVLAPGSQRRGDGLAAAFGARATVPGCGIVVLSNHAEPALLARISRPDLAGFAYLLKGTASDIGTLLRAIEVAASGGTMIDPGVAAERPPHTSLSAHQDRVMRMLASGASNAAIAEALGTSTKSVEHAITGIMEALGIDSADPRVNPRVAATLAYLDVM